MSLRLTQRARRDLLEIWEYIATDNARAAEKTVGSILRRFDLLEKNPLLGRRRHDLRAEYRSVTVGSYVIFYLTSAEDVEVIRVLHGRRDLLAALRE